mmetsp:Transcript_4773/g.8673  ORF Transcript_4773/g.8673 Transcript_4773/m.8673 type:complete len:334 (-) Transcript_4773:1247-2248(-)
MEHGVVLRDVIINDGDVNKLFGLARSKGQRATALLIVRARDCAAVAGMVVNSDGARGAGAAQHLHARRSLSLQNSKRGVRKIEHAGVVVVDDDHLGEGESAETEGHAAHRAQRGQPAGVWLLSVILKRHVERLILIRVVVVVDGDLDVLDNLACLKGDGTLHSVVVRSPNGGAIARLVVDTRRDAQGVGDTVATDRKLDLPSVLHHSEIVAREANLGLQVLGDHLAFRAPTHAPTLTGSPIPHRCGPGTTAPTLDTALQIVQTFVLSAAETRELTTPQLRSAGLFTPLSVPLRLFLRHDVLLACHFVPGVDLPENAAPFVLPNRVAAHRRRHS